MSGNTTFFAKAADMKITWKDIFSSVFKKHSKEDGARLFIAGTPLSTPHESRMLAEWQKPWLFAYAGIFGVAFIVLLFVLQTAGGQSTIYLMPLMFVGSFIIPLVVVLMMWEMNIPRNIPIYSVLGMILVGGALSLIFTFLVHSIPSLDPIFAKGAQWAALSEEPAKLLAICIFMRKPKRSYVLNGILIGAAVGAGFAAIETMDYAFFRQENMILQLEYTVAQMGMQIDLSAKLPELRNANLLMRGILAPGGHVVWAALYGGALALAKGAEPLKPRHFTHKWFLVCFACAFALHYLWNSGIELFTLFTIYTLEVPTPQGIALLPTATIDLFHVILTVVAWIVLLRLIKQGVVQCMRIPQTTPAPVPQMQPVGVGAGAATPYALSVEIKLRGLSGLYKGNVFPSPGGRLIIGRDNRRANVVFPPNTPGISSVHCEITYQNGVIYITDKNSSNGTFLADGTRLTPERPYPISRRSGFYLATRENMFEIE